MNSGVIVVFWLKTHIVLYFLNIYLEMIVFWGVD